MVSAEIDGDLDCRNSSFAANDLGNSLCADRARISGSVVFSQSLVHGTISLSGADVGGQINCVAARVVGAGAALALDLATVRGGIDLTRLESNGELRLMAAHITGSLNCTSAILAAPHKALSMDRAIIRGSVFLRNVRVAGAIVMSNSRIDPNLDCRGASLATVHCANMKLEGDLTWTNMQNKAETSLNLAAASLRNLQDDKADWPSPGNLVLDRLVYEELSLYPSGTAGQV